MQLADGAGGGGALCLKGMTLGMAASAAVSIGDGTSGASGCGVACAVGVAACDESVADGAVEGCVAAGAVASGSGFVCWNAQVGDPFIESQAS